MSSSKVVEVYTVELLNKSITIIDPSSIVVGPSGALMIVSRDKDEAWTWAPSQWKDVHCVKKEPSDALD